MSKVTYRGVSYETSSPKQTQKQEVQLSYRGQQSVKTVEVIK